MLIPNRVCANCLRNLRDTWQVDGAAARKSGPARQISKKPPQNWDLLDKW
jgi:hypothetical protein